MGKRVRGKKHDIAKENDSTSDSTSASVSVNTSPHGRTSQHGRGWSIFNIMKYHHWPHDFKKRHTHKKNGGEKSPESEADNMQDNMPSSGSYKEIVVHSTNSPAKKSVKAKLKAFIAHEIARKKQQNKRSSTHHAKPEKPHQDTAIPNFDHSDLTLVPQEILAENNPTQVPHNSETSEDLATECSTANKEVCVECGTMFCSGGMEHNSMVHKHQRPPLEYQRALMKETLSCENKSMHAKLLTTDVSPYMFKDFLDALDMINSNKELMLKYLQQQHSPLACQLPIKQEESTRDIIPNSSSSIPVPASSSPSKVRGQDTDQMTHEMIKSREVQNDSQIQCEKSLPECPQESDQHSLSLDSSNHALAPSMFQKPRSNKHLKGLTQKLKHVLGKRKKEKLRIAMDVVYDKIPHGNKNPIVMKRNIPKASMNTNSPSELRSSKKRPRSPRRTASLNESVWKYSQLYETSFDKKSRYPGSELLRLKTLKKNPLLKPPRSFQRFLSLPNLKDYFSKNEEPSSILPLQIPKRKFGERTSISSNSVGNIITLESALKSVQTGIAMKSDAGLVADEDEESNQNEIIGIDDYLGQLTDSDINESTSVVADTKSISLSGSNFLNDSIGYDEKLSLPEDLKIMPWPVDELDHYTEQVQELDIAGHHKLVSSEEGFQNFSALNKNLSLRIPCLEVDTFSEAEFNYVKDVLELSGLSTSHESLFTWYSRDQLLDPTVYDELEGCLLFDPESSGNEESSGAHCNHLVLFDLINEVLIEIFGRSYSYYSKPLSSLCHLYPIPVGDQVLREVWTLIKWHLKLNSELDPSLDYYVSRDMEKSDGWMNLQFDSECVGFELDDLIFDDLLTEIICN